MSNLPFICPRCALLLKPVEDAFLCENPQCKTVYPVINGVPVLINEQNSILRIAEFMKYYKSIEPEKKSSLFFKLIYKIVPEISANINAPKNLKEFVTILLNKNRRPKILIIGGAVEGVGMRQLLERKDIDIIGSDIYITPMVDVILDAHDIPFPNDSLDGVIIQAVLEHVADPQRVVSEIHRVLREDGIVYAEIPFIQQHHLGAADFTRFTSIGLRRLFRNFAEIKSGPVCGPGMAMAWSVFYFFASFTESSRVREIIRIFTSFLTFYLKYFDYYLIKKPGSQDSASGFFFLGRRTNTIIDDRTILGSYKGLVR